jgi:hypothetical protein
MRINVLESKELLATIYAIRSFDKTLQAQIRKQTKAVAEPEWKKSIAERANTRVEHRVIVDTARVAVSNQNVRVQSANVGRPLSGGLNPKTQYPAVEFGIRPKKVTYDRTSRKGGTHKVTRTIGNGLPNPRKRGPFWGAAENMIPRLARLWVQTTVRTLSEALEGKS